MPVKLRVVHIAPPDTPVGPHADAPAARVVASLVACLLEDGHEVMLCAHPDSVTAAPLYSVLPPRGDRVQSWMEGLHLSLALRLLKSRGADVVHVHDHGAAVVMAHFIPCPVVWTLYHPLPPLVQAQLPLTRADVLFAVPESAPWPVQLQGLRRVTIDHAWIPASPQPKWAKQPYLVFAEPIGSGDGVGDAIEVARTLGLPLKVLTQDAELRGEPFHRAVAPHLAHGVEVLTNLDDPTRRAVLGRARALLCTSRHADRLPLSLIEAMSLGTPAVAWAGGAAQAWIAPGETGFVAHDVAQMCAAVTRVDQLSPARCRERAQRWTSKRDMYASYLAAYAAVLPNVEAVDHGASA